MSAQPAIMDLGRQIGTGLDVMVDIWMGRYPIAWTDDERRAAAREDLGLAEPVRHPRPTGGFLRRLKRDVRARDGDNCCWCGARMIFHVAPPFPPRFATLEHVIELSKGGSNEMDNLKLACLECNQARNELGPVGDER